MLLALLPRFVARHVRSLAAVVVASAAALTALAQTPSALDGFNPNVDGNVYALATQPDGKVIVGGQFTTLRVGEGEEVARANLARLNVDGTIDTSFTLTANAPVRAIVVQPDGRIIIGGDFTALQPGTGAAISRGRIARFSANGTVDATFNPNVGGALQPQVVALLLQPSGQLVAGGSFTTAQPNGAATPFVRNHLARFNADGSLDTSFDPNPNSMVLSLAQHVSNKIVVGGGFTSFWAAGDSAPVARNRIARLNANGTVDSEFNPDANNAVNTLAVQRDGKIILGGTFTTLKPIGDAAAAGRQRIARLNVDGSLDSEFLPRADGAVVTLAVQPDGGILVGGSFTNVWGRGTSTSSRSYVARFLPDGSLDTDFAPVLNATVAALAFQADGKVVLGGYFTRARPPGTTTAVVRNRLARVNADGSLDTSFELTPGGRVLTSVTQSDGRLVVGGSFTSAGGATHNYLARLNADGTVDATYNPSFNAPVYTTALQADGKVIVGGAFTTIGGETRNHIARLNPSGTIDSEFNPSIDGQVGVVLLQPDGKILVGGTFNSVTPARTTSATQRLNLLRLNADGTLDTTFDPSPNSSVSAMALQSDGKILVGGQFTSLTPGLAASTSATTTGRGYLARLNADGTLDSAYNANANARVSAIAIQSDGKAVVAGAFTAVQGTGSTTTSVRNRIARFNTDGAVDTAYDPNANGNVLALALQPDGRLLIGGAFTTLQPNGASDWTLRKYAARLNTDGTVDSSYNLDLNESPGNRVDSLRVLADGRVLIGGSFTSLQPAASATRVTRRTFARLAANGAVDTTFDASAGGSTGAVVNAFAVQPDNKVIAVGRFTDLGGAKTTNIARFNAEGTPDANFSSTVATDGPVLAVGVRPNAAPVASQLTGFAWLNRDGTLRPAFATGGARLSGEINALAVQADGAVLLGGTFTNLDNSTGGNLVRVSPTGTIDLFFNPAPNGTVTSIIVQADGRILIAGGFTTVAGVTRNRIARINADGTLDTTFDPNANGRINAMVLQGDGAIVIGGAFTTLQPNFAATATPRNYLARLNNDGGLDANYNPNPNFNVAALALQADGKVVAGGGFTTVQPNAATTATNRNGIARFNTDGSVDTNFDPNANGVVNAIAALANGQFLIGGNFSTLQPSGGAVVNRSNLARINSDGTVDAGFNPSPSGTVTALAVQSDSSVIVGGAFTSFQPNATGASVTRNRLARVNADGNLDLTFNPDVNGVVNTILARPDGSVLVGGSFSELQLIGSVIIGGNFATVGGVPARNLAMLNEEGSINATFLPRPDGAVNALLVQPDGKVVAGGAFGTIAGATRPRLARFNADGTLDTAFAPALSATAVNALALQADSRILVGTTSGLVRLNADGSADASFASDLAGPITALAVQADGRIVAISAESSVVRLTATGARDSAALAATTATGAFRTLALQADGGIVVGGSAGITAGGVARPYAARFRSDGSLDPSFNPAPNGVVTAVAVQSDGRVLLGGGFNAVGGVPRVGIARLGAPGNAAQVLGVSANRSTVMWSRTGLLGEVSAVIFELSTDQRTWTTLGVGRRVANTSDWQLTGLSLPANGVFYLRARGITVTSGTSSGLTQSVREFNFSNPVGSSLNQTTTPVQAAAPGMEFDPVTGVAVRAALIVVPGEDTVEIIAGWQNQAGEPVPARLANLSTRGRVTADTPLILGFAVSGSEPRSLLVRAVGPALAGFGVTDALPAARLQIFDAAGALITTVNAGGSAAEALQAATRTGAFPIAAGSSDSAALVTLAPGNYTAQVVDAQGRGGVGLAEIYDAGTGTGSRLVNVSSRASTGSGSEALISGFVIAGGNERVLLRGVGPTLTQFGATGAVADPAIAVFDASGFQLGGNDNWVSSVTNISAAAARAGAFSLAAGSKDAAVLATLPAGAYTVQVSSATRGAALLEIYEVP